MEADEKKARETLLFWQKSVKDMSKAKLFSELSDAMRGEYVKEYSQVLVEEVQRRINEVYSLE